MLCPNCESYQTQVADTREMDGCIYRRRKCLDCRYRFSTYEYQPETIARMAQLMAEDKYRINEKRNEMEEIIENIVLKSITGVYGRDR